MKFARLYIPDSLSPEQALPRTTHLGIGAHQDDLEFMALHGILQCFQSDKRWFGGVTCTDGGGSSRSGPYSDFSDDQMKAIRAKEQEAASLVGQYSFMAQLGHPSTTAKEPAHREPLIADLERILITAKPEIVYTHNPFDKHATHVGVLEAVLAAVKRLPIAARPKQLIGCEVWRSLDWLPDELKIIQSLDTHPNLAAALNGIFDSQIVGGKRYDLAVEGRRVANATFLDAHSIDDAQRVAYAIDLTPLIQEEAISVTTFCNAVIDSFRKNILNLYKS